MKSEKSLWSSVSILIGAVIAVLAFVRGDAQIWLLLGVFAIWGAWVILFLLMPFIKQAKKKQMRKARMNALYREGHGTSQQNNLHPAEGEGGSQLLLCHVNLRITGYLRSIYQDATWEWCEKNPAQLILNGGIGRIRVYGAEEYDHADVKIDKRGKEIDGHTQVHISNTFNGQANAVLTRIKYTVLAGAIVLKEQQTVSIWKLVNILGFSCI